MAVDKQLDDRDKLCSEVRKQLDGTHIGIGTKDTSKDEKMISNEHPVIVNGVGH